jgi:hypothetical protein
MHLHYPNFVPGWRHWVVATLMFAMPITSTVTGFTQISFSLVVPMPIGSRSGSAKPLIRLSPRVLLAEYMTLGPKGRSSHELISAVWSKQISALLLTLRIHLI